MLLHDQSKCEVAKLIEKWKRSGSLAEFDRHRLISQLNAMRMVCDSSYLLDQKTRYETKTAEVMSIVEEMILQGSEKAVIFSQWERMTRLIALELDIRNIPYQYLHGNVPSKQRGELLNVFTNDKNCKVFLSTDAGSVGLNLQVASIIINVDIPWSPAVLEQRISRIHRLGQKNHSTVINIIAAGTIEQRMLDVIAFKDSLAKGILDNGDDSVFMGESRFKSFIGEIEKIIDSSSITNSESIAQDDIEQQIPFEKNTSKPLQLHLFEEEESIDQQNGESQNNTLEISRFIESSIRFFDQCAEILADEKKLDECIQSITETDSVTGERYLKIPIENPEVHKKGLLLFSSFLSRIQDHH
jgi:superfamily II DNA/RNA helicase